MRMSTHEKNESYLQSIYNESLKPLSSATSRENLKCFCDSGSTVGVAEFERMISPAIQALAWAEGYLMARGAAGCGDSGHAHATKNADKHLKKIRKAMGFTKP